MNLFKSLFDKLKLGLTVDTSRKNSPSNKKVSGNIIQSVNQQGGVTAHTININEAQAPEWKLTASEKINDSEWRTKFSAKAIGSLPYYNWNILFTFNAKVLKREDVSNEVSVGPWMPLTVDESRLSENHFFIGFLEFKPGQYFALYLYSKESLEVVDHKMLKI